MHATSLVSGSTLQETGHISLVAVELLLLAKHFIEQVEALPQNLALTGRDQPRSHVMMWSRWVFSWEVVRDILVPNYGLSLGSWSRPDLAKCFW